MLARRIVLALVLVSVALVPLWGPAALRPMRYFGVRRVEVSGTRYLAPSAVVEALGLGAEASVFDDLDVARERLAEFVGLDSATVGRRLPGTLVVRVHESEAVALADTPLGLVAVDAAGRPLPFDLAGAPLDAPVVPRADTLVLAALQAIRLADLGFYAGVGAAWRRGGEVVLDLGTGHARLTLPVEPESVRNVAAVQRDLATRDAAWRELDGRFRGWVVVRPRGGGGA